MIYLVSSAVSRYEGGKDDDCIETWLAACMINHYTEFDDLQFCPGSELRSQPGMTVNRQFRSKNIP